MERFLRRGCDIILIVVYLSLNVTQLNRSALIIKSLDQSLGRYSSMKTITKLQLAKAMLKTMREEREGVVKEIRVEFCRGMGKKTEFTRTEVEQIFEDAVKSL